MNFKKLRGLFSCLFLCSMCRALPNTKLGQNIQPESKINSVNTDFLLLGDDVQGRTKRSVISKIWESPLHYEISADFSEEEKQVIHDAVNLWSDVVCLEFMYHPNSDYTGDKLSIVKQDSVCGTYVGQQVTPTQVMKLDCDNWEDRIVRGIGHIIGLWRENMRQDRDEYIFTNYDNIPEESMAMYGVKKSRVFGVPYDYNSVMHTWPREHTVDPNVDSLQAIGPYAEYYQAMIGQSHHPTFFDIKQINMAYDAVCGCMATTSITCENGGFHDTSTACTSCICPDGYGGQTCSQVIGSSGCSPSSGVISVTSTEECVETPDYGTSEYSQGDTCAWLLQTVTGGTIEMYFAGDQFYVTEEDDGRCQHWVELKVNVTERGPRFCGPSPSEFTSDNPAVSVTNEAMVYFNAESAGSVGAGARICFRQASDECDPDPCFNGGVCQDGMNSFTCGCPAGFTGSQCQTNINECDPYPCQNGGTCVDGVNGFTCKCRRKYNGTLCQNRKRRGRGKK